MLAADCLRCQIIFFDFSGDADILASINATTGGVDGLTSGSAEWGIFLCKLHWPLYSGATLSRRIEHRLRLFVPAQFTDERVSRGRRRFRICVHSSCAIVLRDDSVLDSVSVSRNSSQEEGVAGEYTERLALRNQPLNREPEELKPCK